MNHPNNQPAKSVTTNPTLLLKLLIASVCINVLMVGAYVVKRLYFSGSLVTDKFYDAGILGQMKDKAALYETLPNDSAEIIFAGNSITLGFPVAEMFGSIKIKNRGVGYNRARDIVERINEITETQPARVFLMVGINDIESGIPVEDIMDDFKKIVAAIRKQSPSTKIFVQSVLPIAVKERIPVIEKLNNQYREFCKNNNIVFINLYPAYLKDNVLDSSLTTDGLHLNKDGYLLWKQLIEDYLREPD